MAVLTEKTVATTMKSTDVPALYDLLATRRAHNSPGEKQYIRDYIMPLQPQIIATADHNEVMAFFVYVGESDIMFTSHVDTVHMNTPELYQDILLLKGLYCKNDNQPLGADDAAGNWLMFNMIHNKVPGIYAFFRGEERGGIGSSYCAKHHPELFKNVKVAIAFDRRGTSSIITHQGAGRGCSDEFAKSLSRILDLGHTLDPTGIYTDTAEFFHLVPNCTNISVGYLNEHSKKETLNKDYIEALRDALLEADWSALDHTVPVPDPISPHADYTRGYSLFGPREIPLETPDLDVGMPEIADFLFDYADRLPHDLAERAYALAQRIYKRLEQ